MKSACHYLVAVRVVKKLYSKKATHRMGESMSQHLSDQELVSRICRELLKDNHNKTKQLYAQMIIALEQTFSKDTQMANKYKHENAQHHS